MKKVLIGLVLLSGMLQALEVGKAEEQLKSILKKSDFKIHKVAGSGDIEQVKDLIKANAYLAKLEKSYVLRVKSLRFDVTLTPLIFAVYGGHSEVVEALLAAGADPNYYHLGEETQRNLRMNAGYRMFWNKIGFVRMLVRALEKGEEKIAKALLEAGADVGMTLSLAVRKSSPEIVKMLLDRDANPMLPYNIIHLAAASGSLEKVEMLLKAGADPRKLRYGKKAVGYTNSSDIIEALRKEEKKLNDQDEIQAATEAAVRLFR